MKKMLLSLLFIFSSIGIFSQVEGRANRFSLSLIQNGQFNWSDWKPCDIPVFLNPPEYVYIGSMYYKITSTAPKEKYDDKGGESFSCNFKDDEGEYGTMTFRIDPNGNRQLYIYYDDVAAVYNIIEL